MVAKSVEGGQEEWPQIGQGSPRENACSWLHMKQNSARVRFVIEQIARSSPRGEGMRERLHELWANSELCDCEVRCASSGERVRAHRLVLAASSAYFRALFAGAGAGMLEGLDPSVNIPGCEPGTIHRVIASLYSNALDEPSSLDDACSLLRAAHALDCEDVMLSCEHALFPWLRPPLPDAHTAFVLLQLGVTLGRSALKRGAIDAIASLGLPQLESCSSHNSLAHFIATLDFDAIHALVSALPERFIPSASSSIALASLMGAWADLSPYADASALCDLLSTSPAVLCGNQAIDTLFRTCEAAWRDDKCIRVLHQAAQIHDKSPFHPYFGPSSPGNTLIAAGGHESTWRPLNMVEVLTGDSLHHVWKEGLPLPNQKGLSFLSAAPAPDGRVYMLGGTSFKEQLLAMNPNEKRSQMENGSDSPFSWQWVPASMNQARVLCGLSFANQSLFAFGGRHKANAELSTVEMLNVYDEGCKWMTCSERMTRARSCCASAVLQNATCYAVGGQANNVVFDDIEARDASRGQWFSIQERMQVPRKYCSAVELCGCLYVAGGMNAHRQRLRSVEFLDPRAPDFQQVAPMTKARSSFGMTSIGGSLVACGGNADNAINQSAELFEPRTMTWRRIAPLQVPRAGLVLVTV